MDRIIVEETLFNQKKKKIIYKRNISKKIEINEKLRTAKEKKFLDFYINDFEFDKKFKNTFLNYMATKNSNNLNFIEIIKKVYAFFDKIYVINTNTQFVSIEELFDEKDLDIANILNNYGFNIKNIEIKEVPSDYLFGNENDEKKKKIKEFLNKNERDSYHLLIDNSPFKFMVDQNGDLKVYKILFVHNNNELYEYDEESEGTQRIFDLLPIIYLFNKKDYIFFIDELDRSLSTHLSYEFLSSFLEQIGKGKNSNQIIFTTHNLQFLDFNLLRKDEIYLVENEKDGSKLINLNTIHFRTDMDLKNAYWKGTIGGVSKRLIQTIKNKQNSSLKN